MISILLPAIIGVFYMAFQEAHAVSPVRIRTYSNGKIGYDVEAVARQARNLASHSWEYGTAAEALLELYNPDLSVFGKDPFPEGGIPVVNWTRIDALNYVRPFILTNNQTLIDGDGAVGDPASLGVSTILIGETNQTYLDAATRQADYILRIAPRYWNNAISQRDNTPELWADFVYMAPPFLAYYAVSTQNTTLLEDTITQCGLYREILLANVSSPGNQSTFQGVWEHIIGPDNYQPALWNTGNAWAAAGMARVLATTMKWNASASWLVLQADLTSWIKEIIDGVILSQNTLLDLSNGLIRNNLNDTAWFGETSGTALLTSVIYRMAVLDPSTFGSENGKGYIEWAEKLRGAIADHVDAGGILSPAIDPLNWDNHLPFTTGSPEGECFGVILAAAYRDWLRDDQSRI